MPGVLLLKVSWHWLKLSLDHYRIDRKVDVWTGG